jgi:choline-sulfatase
VGERLYQLRDRMRTFDSVPLRYELPFLAFRYYQQFTGWPSVRGEVVVDEFLETLSGESEPFFGWTHLMDVHGPLEPGIVEGGGLSSDGRLSQYRSHARRVSNVYDPRTEARYDSAVRYVDQQVQRIVNWLQDEGLWEETALIVTADHGDALGDRGIYGHPQHYMYDELLGVPLIVRVPGREGGRIEGAFSLGWVHELVAEICGVDTMDAPVTSSRASLLSDGALEDVVLADSVRDRGHSVAAWRADEKFVVQTEELSGAAEAEIGPQGYYDLATDPTERRALEEGADALEAAAREVVVEPARLRDSESSSKIDAETADQLKQLGYAE